MEIPARVTDEPRSVVIGMIGDKHWSAVITYRSDNIRLMPVRRSRKKESSDPSSASAFDKKFEADEDTTTMLDTMMRVPLIQALPWQTAGSTAI